MDASDLPAARAGSERPPAEAERARNEPATPLEPARHERAKAGVESDRPSRGIGHGCPTLRHGFDIIRGREEEHGQLGRFGPGRGRQHFASPRQRDRKSGWRLLHAFGASGSEVFNASMDASRYSEASMDASYFHHVRPHSGNWSCI